MRPVLRDSNPLSAPGSPRPQISARARRLPAERIPHPRSDPGVTETALQPFDRRRRPGERLALQSIGSGLGQASRLPKGNTGLNARRPSHNLPCVPGWETQQLEITSPMESLLPPRPGFPVHASHARKTILAQEGGPSLLRAPTGRSRRYPCSGKLVHPALQIFQWDQYASRNMPLIPLLLSADIQEERALLVHLVGLRHLDFRWKGTFRTEPDKCRSDQYDNPQADPPTHPFRPTSLTTVLGRMVPL